MGYDVNVDVFVDILILILSYVVECVFHIFVCVCYRISLFAAQQVSTVKRLADTWEGLASMVKLDDVDNDADSGY